MKKLKNINFKALFVDHGEKMGLGVIALIVCAILGRTAWKPYEKSPKELLDKINNARAQIVSPNNKWPQDKVDFYKVVDFNDQARQVFAPLALSSYEYSTPLYNPLYRRKELASEPDYSPIEFLIADAGTAILSVADTSAAGAAGQGSGSSSAPATAEEAPAATAGFRIPGQTSGAGTPNGGVASGVGAAPGTGAYIPPNTSPQSSRAGSHAEGSGGAFMTPGGAPDMYGSGMPGAVSGATPRGVRFVAIRGVFPLQKQIENYVRRLHVTSAEAGTMFELLDFVLERQEAVAGNAPWGKDWEEVKVESALEVLKECADFDPDPVQTGITDAVITMALPSRLLEYWGDNATHPKVKDFQLSPAEMERELKLWERVKEEYERSKPAQAEVPRRRGLAGAQADLRSMGNEMMASANAGTFMSGMAAYMNEAGSGPRVGIPDLQQRLSANGRLLLFRYFDFDVQPGMAYRYRVKLKFRNPNFERPVDEVNGPELVQGPERESPWSNISNPAVVPVSVNYFVKDVERDPSRDDKRSSKAVANINFYEWSTEFGTFLSETLKIGALGQYIADPKKKSVVINPGTPSYVEKDVAFLTEDAVLDVIGDLEFRADEHPHLQLKGEGPQKKARLGLAPEVLVVTALGELKELNRAIDRSKEVPLETRVKQERDAFKHLKEAPEQGSALDAAGAYNTFNGSGSAMSGDYAPPGASGGKAKGKNPKKLSSSSGSSASSGSSGSGGAHAQSSGGGSGSGSSGRGRSSGP